MKENKGHGLIIDEITPDNYIFGGLTKIEEKKIQWDGQWDRFLPEAELQKRNGLETSNCAVYGTLNAIEILTNRLFGKMENYSERHVGILAGTTERGNSPHKVAETIRYISGLIPDEDLPFDDSIKTREQYFGPNPLPRALVEKGRKWIDGFDFKHEYVFNQGEKYKAEIMMQALPYSPLGVSVYAWEKNEETGLYEKVGQDNHWLVCYGFEAGLFWKVFDHYDNFHKRLKWDTDFQVVKKYNLSKKQPKRSFWSLFQICQR